MESERWWALSAVIDDPIGHARMVSKGHLTFVIQQLLMSRRTDICLQVMSAHDFSGYNIAAIVDDQESLIRLLDQMASQGIFRTEIATLSIGRFGAMSYLFRNYRDFVVENRGLLSGEDRYWKALFGFEIGKRDTRRAWEVLVMAHKGFKSGDKKHPPLLSAGPSLFSRTVDEMYPTRFFSVRPHVLSGMVDELYALMLSKKQLQDKPLTPGGLPEKKKYRVCERGRSTKDRFGRVREPRRYALVGRVPGYHIADYFRDHSTDGRPIGITGQKILAIASYFS